MLEFRTRPPMGSPERMFLDFLILSTCEETGLRQQVPVPDDEFLQHIYRLAEMGWLHFECDEIPDDDDEEFDFAILLHGPEEFNIWPN